MFVLIEPYPLRYVTSIVKVFALLKEGVLDRWTHGEGPLLELYSGVISPYLQTLLKV